MSVEFAKKVLDMLSESERHSLVSELLKSPKKAPVKKVILTDQQARAIIYKTFEKKKNPNALTNGF